MVYILPRSYCNSSAMSTCVVDFIKMCLALFNNPILISVRTHVTINNNVLTVLLLITDRDDG